MIDKTGFNIITFFENFKKVNYLGPLYLFMGIIPKLDREAGKQGRTKGARVKGLRTE